MISIGIPIIDSHFSQMRLTFIKQSFLNNKGFESSYVEYKVQK